MPWAELLLEVFANLETSDAAFGAVLCPFVLAGRADIPPVLTDIPVQTGITAAAALLNDESIAYFL